MLTLQLQLTTSSSATAPSASTPATPITACVDALYLAGRRFNDRMGTHVAETVVKRMLQSGIGVCHSRVLVLGLSLAFKENCPDL